MCRDEGFPVFPVTVHTPVVAAGALVDVGTVYFHFLFFHPDRVVLYDDDGVLVYLMWSYGGIRSLLRMAHERAGKQKTYRYLNNGQFRVHIRRGLW